MITFIPPKKVKGFTTIENILCEDGYLIVFSNLDDCTQYIQKIRYRAGFERYVQIVSVSFVDIVEIADQNHMNVLIDVDERRNSKCFMYAHKEKQLKAVIMQ